MIKKIISVLISVMLLASMFTGVVFAQEATATVSYDASVNIFSDGKVFEGVTAYNDRMSFAIFDFSEIMPYLYAADKIEVFTSRTLSSQKVYGLILTAIDDSFEQYVDHTTLTWTNAASYGMTSGGYLLAQREDTTESTGVTLDVDKAALISALETGDNGTVAVRFNGTAAGNTQVSNVTFKITYDNETYVNTIANDIDWADISDQDANAISQNLTLPSKCHGCDVTWESTSDVIDAATGKVTAGTTSQNVTLTAHLSHGGLQSSKTFELTVPVGYVSPQTYVADPALGIYVRNAGGANTDDAYAPTTYPYAISASGYNTAFISYDFAGNEAAVFAAKEITFSANTTYTSTEKIRKLNIYAINDSLESGFDNQLTWNKANTGGYLSGGTLIGQYTGDPVISVSVDIDKEAFASALKQNPANTRLVLRFNDTTGNATSINWSTAKFTFKYDAADVAFTDYLNNLVSDLKWSDVSDQAETAITVNLNLPSKIYGTDIVWSSDNTAITDTGVVTQSKTAQTVKLTANFSYNGEQASKTFELTVPAILGITETVSIKDAAYVRGGSDKPDAAGVPQDSSEYLIASAGTQYRAYVIFDLSGKESVIENLSSAKFSIKVGGSATSTTACPFNLVMLHDYGESCIKTGMTYNDASAAGIIDTTAGTVVAIQDTILSNGTVYESTDIAQALKSAISSNPTNSLVAFGLVSTKGQGYFHSTTPTLTLEYHETVAPDDFFNSKKDALIWEHVSSQAQNNIRENLTLPSKFYGFDLSWSSDNEAVVSSDGIVTRTSATGKATLTATISYNGNNASKDFELTVPKTAYAYGDELYEGTKAVTIDGGSNNIKFASSEGVYGKESSDMVYEITSQNSTAFGAFDTSTASGNDDILEFSAYIPAGAEGISFNVGIVDGSQYGSQVLFAVKNDGIYHNYGSNKNLISRVSPDEWHTYAFVAPKGDGEDTTYEMYVDGSYVSSFVVAATTSGFRHIRAFGSGTDINVVNGYMDNIRIYSGSYETKYDLNPDFTSTYDVAGRIITLTEETTIADIKSSISLGEGVRYVIKDASGNVITDDKTVATEGMKLYVTTVNDTEIDRNYAVYSLRSVVGEYVIDAPVITVDGDTITAKYVSYNYTDEDEEYTIILAVYSDEDELLELATPTTVDSFKLNKADNTLTVTYVDDCYIKAMVWDDMVNIEPLITAVVK